MGTPNDEDFYSDDDHQGDHIDEKWLISYSDMMTLLFGFFVMMYILSTTNKAKMEETLQKISKEGFNADSAATNEVKPITSKMEKTQSNTENILIELKKRKEDKAKIKELEDNLIQIKEVQVKNDIELKEALEKIKKTEEEKIEFQAKLKELEQESAELSDQKTNKEIEQLKKLKKERLLLENNLKIAVDKNKLILEENTTLKKKMEDEGPKINDDDHFMMVFVRWETEKHDVDMIVEDPKGNIFNYKKRTLASVPGEFVIDSTQGPGVESWVTNKTIEGIYKVTFKFYNQYGNKKDAIIQASVFNNLKVEKLPAVTLNFAQYKEKTISIQVAKDGQFKIMP